MSGGATRTSKVANWIINVIFTRSLSLSFSHNETISWRFWTKWLWLPLHWGQHCPGHCSVSRQFNTGHFSSSHTTLPFCSQRKEKKKMYMGMLSEPFASSTSFQKLKIQNPTLLKKNFFKAQTCECMHICALNKPSEDEKIATFRNKCSETSATD